MPHRQSPTVQPVLAFFAGALLLTLPVLLGGVGCEDKPLPAPAIEQQEKLVVLATVYPLADVARQIGGEWIAVEWLAESGQPLPGNDPSSDVYRRVLSVDVVISSGEPWAVEGFDDPMRAGRVVRLDVLPAAASAPTPRGLMWLDPAVVREAAEEIYKSFATKRPALQHHFRKRTDAFLEQLDSTVAAYESVLRTQPPRKALVLSSDWARLLARFRIDELGLHEDVDPSALTAAHVRRLTELSRQYRITSVLVSTETSPAAITELQNRTELTARPLERLGTSAGVGRNTYLDILRHNLDQLNQAASRPQS